MNLYLGIPQDSGLDWGYFPYFPIYNYLMRWLNSCCSEAGPVRVLTIDKPLPQMTRLDGLVYLVGDPTASVISRVGASASPDLATGRTSGWRGQLISEVYVKARQP